MNKKIKISIWILVILLISNIFSNWIYLFIGDSFYNFQTFDKKYEFGYDPIKGGNIDLVKDHFQIFCLRKPEYEDTQLYRTFWRNPLLFWNWYNYLTAEDYKFPYSSPVENYMKRPHFTYIPPKETICLFFYNDNKEKCRSKDKEGSTIIVDKYRKEVTPLTSRDSIVFYVRGECFVVTENMNIDTCSSQCLDLQHKKIKTIKEMQRWRELTNDLESYINNPYKQIYIIERNNEQFITYPVKWVY